MKKCPGCKVAKNYTDFYKNKTKYDGVSTRCKSCVRLYNKEYYHKNSEKVKKSVRDWEKNNPQKYKEWRRQNYQERKKDTLYIIEKRLRKRLWQSLQNKSWRKDNSFIEYIGCSLTELRLHIESQFTDNMSWDNYGINGWHIDHIIPLSSANSEEELKQLQHYSNLQPLWAIDNLRKYNKVENGAGQLR